MTFYSSLGIHVLRAVLGIYNALDYLADRARQHPERFLAKSKRPHYPYAALWATHLEAQWQ